MAARGQQQGALGLETAAKPSLIIRHSINLGEQERIIQFETFADRDTSIEEIDRQCDLMRRVSDRQRAIHVLPSYRRTLENIEYKHNGNVKRLRELDAGLGAMDEARAAKTRELQVQLDSALEQAERAHQASGRRGEFRPPGGGEVGRIKGAIDQLAANGQREHAEAQVQRSTLDGEIKEGERAIFQQKALIAEHEAHLRGGAV